MPDDRASSVRYDSGLGCISSVTGSEYEWRPEAFKQMALLYSIIDSSVGLPVLRKGQLDII